MPILLECILLELQAVDHCFHPQSCCYPKGSTFFSCPSSCFFMICFAGSESATQPQDDGGGGGIVQGSCLYHHALSRQITFTTLALGEGSKLLWTTMGFPHNSVGKESACNAGDPGSIRGSGRSAGEGIGYPLQYSWASLVAQLVKNLPAMRETWVRSLGWEDPLEKRKATLSSILAWRIQWTTVPGVSESQTRLSDFHFHLCIV